MREKHSRLVQLGQGGAWLQPPAADVCSPPNKGFSEPPLPLGTLQENPFLRQQKPFPSLHPPHPPPPPPPSASPGGLQPPLLLEPSLAPACPSPSRGAAGSSCGGDPDSLVPCCSWASTCPCCWDFEGGGQYLHGRGSCSSHGWALATGTGDPSVPGCSREELGAPAAGNYRRG